MRSAVAYAARVFKSRVGRTTLWALANLPMAILTGMITARVLGVDLRGTLAIMVSVAGLSVLVGTMGTNVAIRRRLPQGRTTVSRYLLVSVALWCIYLALSQVVAHMLAVWVDPAFAQASVVIVFTSYGALYFWSNQFLDLLNAAGRVPLAAATNAFGSAVCLIGVVLALVLDVGFVGVAWSYVVSMLAQIVLAMIFLRALLRNAGAGKAEPGLLRDGVRLMGLNLGQAITYQGNPVLLGALSTTQSVGLYSVAITPAAVLSLPATAVGQTLMHDAASGRITISRVVRLVAQMELVLGAMALVGWLFADLVIVVLFGESFADAAGVLRVLLLGQLALAPFLVLSKVVVGFGSTWSASLPSMLGAIVLIGLGLIWIPIFGVDGAAWSSVIAYLMMSFVSFMQVMRMRRFLTGVIGDEEVK